MPNHAMDIVDSESRFACAGTVMHRASFELLSGRHLQTVTPTAGYENALTSIFTHQ
jgi:hypothetical protein